MVGGRQRKHVAGVRCKIKKRKGFKQRKSYTRMGDVYKKAARRNGGVAIDWKNLKGKIEVKEKIMFMYVRVVVALKEDFYS